jgi:diguanylate cyclase (GGDEF)-like protein
MVRAPMPLSSNQPDPRVLHVFAALQRLCLVIVTFISVVTLSAWLLPPLARVLPASWDQMKANAALCILLSATSLTLSRSRRSIRSIRISRVLALAVTFIAAITALEHLFQRSTWFDTFLSSSASSLYPGKPAPSTAHIFLLLGVLLFFIRTRKSLLAYLIDFTSLALCTFVLIDIYAPILGAMHIHGSSMQPHLPPQTLFCLALLTFVAFSRRAEYGILSIIFGGGIGGKIARLASPAAILLPFLRSSGGGSIAHIGILPRTEYITAVGSLIAFCFVLFIALRIDGLEKHIRDLSLRDELTGLYNRRGFYFLAEQALRLAHRSGEPFSVLFVDLDNLKQINDALGHEAGSLLLQQMASILITTVRETDAVGRLGGDEFVVAGRASASEITRAAQRLEAAAARATIDNHLHPLSFSFGHVTSDNISALSLDDMLQQADQIMYEAKRQKKSLRHSQKNSSVIVDDQLANQLG